MNRDLVPCALTAWRIVPIRWQAEPVSGEGARLRGGRWNRKGQAALYLATDPATAVAEFYQGLPKPGTLVPFELKAERIADLTGPDATVRNALDADWKALSGIAGDEPPSWTLTADLIAAGAEGVLVPSTQNPGDTNLVLWRWQQGNGPDAALTLLDPDSALRGRSR